MTSLGRIHKSRWWWRWSRSVSKRTMYWGYIGVKEFNKGFEEGVKTKSFSK